MRFYVTDRIGNFNIMQRCFTIEYTGLLEQLLYSINLLGQYARMGKTEGSQTLVNTDLK